jgi:hypothetical protein
MRIIVILLTIVFLVLPMKAWTLVLSCAILVDAYYSLRASYYSLAVSSKSICCRTVEEQSLMIRVAALVLYISVNYAKSII